MHAAGDTYRWAPSIHCWGPFVPTVGGSQILGILQGINLQTCCKAKQDGYDRVLQLQLQLQLCFHFKPTSLFMRG